MIPFEMSEGNPGALTFILSAYNDYPMTARRALFRMEKNGITGCALYMLWNDCCNRDTRMALEAAKRRWKPFYKASGGGVPKVMIAHELCK